MARRRRRNRSRARLLVSISATVLLVGVVLGLARWQDATNLRTAAFRGSGHSGSDYRSATDVQVGYSTGTTKAEDCVPYDASNGGSTPGIRNRRLRWLGAGVVTDCYYEASLGKRGGSGPEPRGYQFWRLNEDERRGITRTPVNGSSALDVMQVICEGERHLPLCPSDSVGCAWSDWGLAPTFRLHGLVEQVRNSRGFRGTFGVYQLFDGFVVAGEPPRQHDVEKVYTAAPDPITSRIPYDLRMSLWSLSSKDRDLLRAESPELLRLAERKLEYTEWHERQHWRIFEQYIQIAASHVNNPGAPSLRASRTALGIAIASTNRNGWTEIVEEENRAHEQYHEQERARPSVRAAVGGGSVACKVLDDEGLRGSGALEPRSTDSGGSSSRSVPAPSSPSSSDQRNVVVPSEPSSSGSSNTSQLSTSLCQPENQTVRAGQRAEVSSQGFVIWSAPDGSPKTGSGSTFRTAFSAPGTYTIYAFNSTAFRGQCSVQVTDSGG